MSPDTHYPMRTGRLHAITSPAADADLVAKVLGIACALLIIASEFKFRNRSAGAALQGNADGQVLIELMVYIVVATWLLVRRLAAEFSSDRPVRRLVRLSALKVMRLFASIAVVSSFWSPTSIATVRAIQYAIAVELVAEVFYVCVGKPSACERFWNAFATTVVIAAGLGIVLTFAHAFGFSPWDRTFQGVKRLRMFFMAPTATAAVLGLAALVAWEPLVRSRIVGLPPLLGRPIRSVARWWLAGALMGLLVLTHERISTLAGICAVGLLYSSARNRTRAHIAGVWAALITTTAIVFFGNQLLALVLRGQTTSAVASGSGRNQIFAVAWHLFRDRPVSGWGYLAGRSVYLPIIPWAGESHDALVEVLVSFGIIGIAVLAAMFARWWSLSKRGRHALADFQRLLAVRSGALVLFVTILGVADDSFAGPPGTPVIALLVALVLAELSVQPAGENEGPSSRYVVQLPAVS